MAEAVRNQQALAIAHDENVAQWAEAIAQSLQDAPEPVVLFPQTHSLIPPFCTALTFIDLLCHD